MKKFKQWLNNGCPLLITRFNRLRKKAQQEADNRRVSELRNLRETHAREIEKTTVAVKEIVEKAAKIDWFCGPSPQRYRFQMDFDVRLLSDMCDHRYGLQLIAEQVSRQIEHEIVSSKFIKEAHRNEADRRYARPAVHVFRPDGEF